MRLVFLSMLSALSFSVIAAQPTDDLTLRMDFGKTHIFNPISDAQSLPSLYGAYQKPKSYTDGTSLHLYPNRRFTIIEWCDICMDELVAKGSYTYTAGIITFTYTNTYGNPKESDLPEKLAAFYGWIQEKGYTTGSEFILINPSEVDLAKGNADFDHYLRRQTWYPDWQSMYDKETAEK